MCRLGGPLCRLGGLLCWLGSPLCRLGGPLGMLGGHVCELGNALCWKPSVQMRVQALSTGLEALCVDASGGPLCRLRGLVLVKRISHRLGVSLCRLGDPLCELEGPLCWLGSPLFGCEWRPLCRLRDFVWARTSGLEALWAG